jgi:hypothetical protein
MTVFKPLSYIVWSTDQLDLSDPFQRRWYLKQVLTHGRAGDIRSLDMEEIRREIDELDLPPEIYSLWKFFLVTSHVEE